MEGRQKDGRNIDLSNRLARKSSNVCPVRHQHCNHKKLNCASVETKKRHSLLMRQPRDQFAFFEPDCTGIRNPANLKVLQR